MGGGRPGTPGVRGLLIRLCDVECNRQAKFRGASWSAGTMPSLPAS
ncbi:MAG: hypothetical protein QOC92_312 [Acidimicrobiaceae bacterium]